LPPGSARDCLSPSSGRRGRQGKFTDRFPAGPESGAPRVSRGRVAGRPGRCRAGAGTGSRSHRDFLGSVWGSRRWCRWLAAVALGVLPDAASPPARGRSAGASHCRTTRGRGIPLPIRYAGAPAGSLCEAAGLSPRADPRPGSRRSAAGSVHCGLGERSFSYTAGGQRCSAPLDGAQAVELLTALRNAEGVLYRNPAPCPATAEAPVYRLRFTIREAKPPETVGNIALTPTCLSALPALGEPHSAAEALLAAAGDRADCRGVDQRAN
jgi:hypothetical protein